MRGRRLGLPGVGDERDRRQLHAAQLHGEPEVGDRERPAQVGPVFAGLPCDQGRGADPRGGAQLQVLHRQRERSAGAIDEAK